MSPWIQLRWSVVLILESLSVRRELRIYSRHISLDLGIPKYSSDWNTSVCFQKAWQSGVQLLKYPSVVVKTFSQLIMNRLVASRYSVTRGKQEKSRSGGRCIDYMLILQKTLEYRYESQYHHWRLLHRISSCVSLNTTQAIVEVNPRQWHSIQTDHFVKIPLCWKKNRIRGYGEKSQLFKLISGIWQEYQILPLLFNFASFTQGGMGHYYGVEVFTNCCVTDLEFTFDTAVLGKDLII